MSDSGERVREVLDLALERPEHERQAYVAGVCGSDDGLRQEVLSLLEALATRGDALEPPAVRPAPPAEPLTGLKFGPFEVGERVGEGGMGVVYRARDTRLGRTVAVKALPAAVARDAHGRARFEHEARVLASLNHPGIATIYGVEDTARGPVMVLEFVPGESLARRLARGPVALDDALAIAAQVARGLEAAHAAGVVHRDLKPANIQLTSEGGVKILDFGIAKQDSGAQAGSGDGALPAHTAPGVVIGTAAYMSPEQARGRPVDRRTDLWAFGCVLFEMLSGRRAFDGDTTSDTVAAVLRADPEWARLPQESPPSVRRLLRRCLEKDPDRRLRDAGDARLELEAGDDQPVPGARRRGRPLAWGALAVGAVVLAYGAGLLISRARTLPLPAAPVQFGVDLRSDAPLAYAAGGVIAASPDGRTLAYSAGPPDRPRLHVRRIDALESEAIPDTEGAVTPFFSPDGRWIGYVDGHALRRVPAGGGPPHTILEGGVLDYGCSWGPDGTIVFVARDGTRLQQVAASGGPALPVTTPDLGPEPRGFAHPLVLPSGRGVLFTAQTLRAGRLEKRIEALLATTPEAARRGAYHEHRVLVPAAACPAFAGPDRLLYWQAGALMAAPFDHAAVRITGEATVLLKPLAGGESVTMPRYAVSAGSGRAGLLAWLPGNIMYDQSRLAWFELDGSTTVIAEGAPAIDGPRLSPDGGRVAVLIGKAGGDVWTYDLARSTGVRLTTGDYHHHPVWTPDGSRISFTHTPPGAPVRMNWMRADGTGAVETLWETPEGGILYPTDFTPDGRRLLITFQPASDTTPDVFVFDLDSRGAPERLLPRGPARYGARLSADGAWIAYTSEETGNHEVYIHRFPSMESKIRVSTEGGYRPVWSRDGRQLFFRYLNRLSAVDVTPAPDAGVSVSSPRQLFAHLPDSRYEVSEDGRRFLMSRPVGDWGPQTRINVVAGWEPGLTRP